MNKKGFTLFTALISLLLVSVALVLIFNMINTEDTYLSLIQDQSSMSDLMTIADLARADAFNTFIITLRSNWEEHASRNPMDLKRCDLDKNWDDFSQWFIKVNYFERSFAEYFARGLVFNLKYKMNPPSYNITIEASKGAKLVCRNNCSFGDPDCECDIEYENPEYGSMEKFENVISEIFKAGGERADIVDCNQDDTHCNGSFFLTLDTTQLADENYELLPIVTVLRTRSNQVIQRPILSRQVYKIYIPWRGLQALRTARNLVLDNDTERNKYPADPEGLTNTGFFAPEIHNTLEQARLGFCDPGICRPRDSFFQTPNSTGSNERCHDIQKELNPSQLLPNTLPISSIQLSVSNYNDPADIKTAFTELYEQSLISNLLHNRNGQTISYNNGLIMEGAINLDYHEGAPDINISKIIVDATPENSKSYKGSPAKSPKPYTPKTFSNLEDMPSLVGGLGLFLKDKKSYSLLDLEKNKYELLTNVTLPTPDQEHQTSLTCAEINKATIVLKFKETDPRYIIKEQYKGVNTSINIQLIEEFTGFIHTPENNWSSLEVMQNNYLNPVNLDRLQPPTTNVTEDGIHPWVCYSQFSSGDSAPCSPEPNN